MKSEAKMVILLKKKHAAQVHLRRNPNNKMLEECLLEVEIEIEDLAKEIEDVTAD